MLVIGIVVWTAACLGGFVWLWLYSATPGTAGTAQVDWPAETRIERDPRQANLIVLVHPRCPCSRASLAELAEIMARCEGLVTAQVLFFKPSEMPDGWELTDLWHLAAAIPGVRVLADKDGREARRFGASTSGQVLLYDQHGRLMFSGGITVARGHHGESTGRQAIVAWLSHGTADRSSHAVFGCPLFSNHRLSDRSLTREEKR